MIRGEEQAFPAQAGSRMYEASHGAILVSAERQPACLDTDVVTSLQWPTCNAVHLIAKSDSCGSIAHHGRYKAPSCVHIDDKQGAAWTRPVELQDIAWDAMSCKSAAGDGCRGWLFPECYISAQAMC